MPWSPSVAGRHPARTIGRDHSKAAYGRRVWKRVRMYKLRTNQRCERCLEGFSVEVHHRNSNALDNRPSNLQALCRSCHSLLTVSERMSRGG